MVLGKSDPLWLGASCSDIVFLEPPNPVVGKLTAATQKGTPSLGVVWGEREGEGVEVDSLRVPNPRRQLDKHCSPKGSFTSWQIIRLNPFILNPEMTSLTDTST